MKTISLEQLAEKLNGKLWVKGDLKRIYLDEGYNTKKMSTKTYVEERNGDFVVKCFIDCPSQSYNWIESQQEEVIESVETKINNIIKQLNLELVDYKINEEKNNADVLVKLNSEAEAKWFTEAQFYDSFGDYAITVFGGKLESDLKSVYEKNKEKAKKQSETQKTESANEITVPAEKIKLGNGKKVSHDRLGFGEILEETDDKVKVLFENHGERLLLKKFANLNYINE